MHRMDEVGSKESSAWRRSISQQRLFDPPLTSNGFKQAQQRAKTLQAELDTIGEEKDRPDCIYVSPTERTLGTAMEIALATQLPLVVVPGLSACAAAVKRGGLIRKKIKKRAVDPIHETDVDDEKKAKEKEAEAVDDYELFLRSYGWMGECPFLSKAQIEQQFGRKGVVIRFDYSRIDRFRVCVERLVTASEHNTIVCVTHREGIRQMDEGLKGSYIPYCAMAKYGCVPASVKSKDVFDFMWFEWRL